MGFTMVVFQVSENCPIFRDVLTLCNYGQNFVKYPFNYSDVIKYCHHPRWYKKYLQLEVGPAIGGVTSNQRCHLWLEVGPPIRGGTSSWRWLMHVGPHRGTNVTCRNQLFFWKKKRDYLLLITSSHHLSTRWNVNLLLLWAQHPAHSV